MATATCEGEELKDRIFICALEEERPPSVSEPAPAAGEPALVADDASLETLEPPAELEGRTSDDVVYALDQLFALVAGAERRIVDEVRYLDTRELYREDGARTMSDWLVERYRISREHAAGLVLLASRLPALPNLDAAHEAGDLCIDQLKPLVRVADEQTDEFLAEQAPGWSEEQCRMVARRLRTITRREAQQSQQVRSLRMFWEDEWLNLFGRLYGDAGAVVEEALRRFAQQSPKAPETGRFEPLEARLADALVQVASQALNAEAEGEADVATVVCHVDSLTLAGVDGHAELDGAHQIAAEAARRLMCDCRFQMVKENQRGEVIGLGRLTRVVPWWLRRVLSLRDRGCRWPGCPRTGWVDRHHIEHWSDGGPTDPGNLLQLCRRHHVVVHEGGWAIEGDPGDEIRFVGLTGRMLASRPAPLRPDLMQRFGLLREWDVGPPDDGQQSTD